MKRGGHTLRRLSALFLCAGVLAACASPPLDIPRGEWAEMSPDQRATAQAHAADLAEARDHTARPDVQARERRDFVEDASRFARIAEHYASGRLGDVMICTLGPGTVGAQDFAAVDFLLAREQDKTLPLRADTGAAAWVSLSPTGRSLRLCRADAPAADSLPCTAAAAPFAMLAQGHTWDLHIPGHLTAPLECAYAVAGDG